MDFRAISLTASALIISGVILAESKPEPSKSEKSSHLVFYHSVCLRGVLRIDKVTGSGPRKKSSTYLLQTPTKYTVSDYSNPNETQQHAGIQEFYIEAPKKFSLIWYRREQVEVCGNLLPRGRLAGPTLVVDSIQRVKDAAKKSKR